MIAVKENFPQLTPEEYFAWEEKQLNKHEYLEGQVYAMNGGSINHGRIAIRFASMFDSHLGSGSCIVGNSDVKVKLSKPKITLTPISASPATIATKPPLNILPIHP